jgi:mRNA interferase MazF
MSTQPRRGDVFLAHLDPIVGSEQSGRRPFLILSIHQMNRAPASLAIGLPLTTTDRSSALHVRIEPTGNGLSRVSYAMPEMARSVSTQRFRNHIGRVPIEVVETASTRTGFLIGLGRIRF